MDNIRHSPVLVHFAFFPSSRPAVGNSKDLNMATQARAVTRLFSLHDAPSLPELAGTCSQEATREQYPLASSVEKNVPIYRLAPFTSLQGSQRAALQEEWYHILHSGPGVFVTKGLFQQQQVATVDNTTKVFNSIIQDERKKSSLPGDHFAAAGKNDRIWNSFSKHALCDPSSFVAYYSNPYLALIASTYLGPGYRVTTQANNVRPGSAAQVPHRDYHLGFQTAEACARIPRAMHVASQFLTLQGAVAHVDIPLESGPTRLLPFSQTYEAGFMAYRRPEFVEFFQSHYVALPMDKGDGIFFNPALFHAAGENVSADVERMANLLQISSPYGKTMETVDSLPILERCWDEIIAMYGPREEGNGNMTEELEALLAAICEAYPFPTNMDDNPPRPGGLTPVGEFDVVVMAVTEGWSKERMLEEVKSLRARSRP